MKFIDLNKQQEQLHPEGLSLKEKIIKDIKGALNNCQFIQGPEVKQLEKELQDFTGSKHCITTSSGTDALLVALMAIGVSEGDEVITTPFSFIATAETIALLGAIPVYADIDPLTFNINPNNIEELITPKTKAIIAVSLYGQPANFNEINKIAAKYNLEVIEDAAQSFGSQHYDLKSCNLSKIAATSFFPSKPLGCYGDGGACFTSDDELAEKMKAISIHGQKKRYYHTQIGINGRLDTIQAIVLLAKLPIFKEEIKLRNKVAEIYKNKINALNIPSKIPYIEEFNTSVYAQYTLRVNDREIFIESMKSLGIPTSVHYPLALNEQPALEKYSLNRKKKNQKCSEAKKASNEVVSLPMHPYLSEQDIDLITKSLKNSL